MTLNKQIITKGHQPKIISPHEGWVEHGVYFVEVRFNANNPIHTALFYTGFLKHGNPSNYNQLWNPTWEDPVSIEKVFYLKAIRYLGKLFNEKTPGSNKLFKEKISDFNIILKPM